MYYDLGCIWVGKSYVKMEEDIHISSLLRLGTKAIIKPEAGKVCWGKVKANSQLSKTNLHQVMSIKENQEPGLLNINSVVKVDEQGRSSLSILNTTTKINKLKKGSAVGKI